MLVRIFWRYIHQLNVCSATYFLVLLCFKQAVKAAKRAPTWTRRCQAKWHQNFPAGKLANRLHNEVEAKYLLHFNLQGAKEMYRKLPCNCVGAWNICLALVTSRHFLSSSTSRTRDSSPLHCPLDLAGKMTSHGLMSHDLRTNSIFPLNIAKKFAGNPP